MANDKQIAEASRLLLNRLSEFMKQKGFKVREELAEYVGISVNTMSHWFRPKECALPRPEALKKLREKISAITDDDARVLETAYSRKISLARLRGGECHSERPISKLDKSALAPSKTVQQAIASSSFDDKDAKIGRLVRQLLMEVQNGNIAAAADISVDPMALLCSWPDERYKIGDMPSVLTKENFKALDVSQWSETEQQQFLAYANLVLEESRKCMLILAQLKPDCIRDKLLERLARNADLLWRTYKAASSVAPMEYIKDIELAHKCEKF